MQRRKKSFGLEGPILSLLSLLEGQPVRFPWRRVGRLAHPLTAREISSFAVRGKKWLPADSGTVWGDNGEQDMASMFREHVRGVSLRRPPRLVVLAGRARSPGSCHTLNPSNGSLIAQKTKFGKKIHRARLTRRLDLRTEAKNRQIQASFSGLIRESYPGNPVSMGTRRAASQPISRDQKASSLNGQTYTATAVIHTVVCLLAAFFSPLLYER